MKLKLENVRLSYANIWEPKADQSGRLKYSVSIIVDKDNTEAVKKLTEAIGTCAKENPAKVMKNGKLKPNAKIPKRDGDVEREEDPAYSNSFFFNATSGEHNPPTIVNRRGKPISERSEVYSGCYANVIVNLFAYDTAGNCGISAGLLGIQKVADGEPLGTGITAGDFEDLGGDDDDGDSFDDLGI